MKVDFNINEVKLLGNLGKDAEVRFTTNNTAIASFSLATVQSYKEASGQYINKTDWHNCVAFNPSEYAKGLLKKGNKVLVTGRLQYGEYTDKDGIKRKTTEIVIDRITPFSGANANTETSHPVNDPYPSAAADTSDDLPF